MVGHLKEKKENIELVYYIFAAISWKVLAALSPISVEKLSEDYGVSVF